MAGGLQTKRKKTSRPVTNRGYDYVTPAPKRTKALVSPEDTPVDQFKSYLNNLNEETGELRVHVIASKVIELLENCFEDNEEDMAAALKHITDDLEVWQPADEDDEDDDGDDELFDDADEVSRSPEVKASKNVVPVGYNPGIFWYHKFVPNEVVSKDYQ